MGISRRKNRGFWLMSMLYQNSHIRIRSPSIYPAELWAHESKILAEREGFEPSKELSSFTRLAGERLQPTRPSLRRLINSILSHFPMIWDENNHPFKSGTGILAEGEGFEPPSPFGEAVFKTAAFIHSAIPPTFSPSSQSRPYSASRHRGREPFRLPAGSSQQWR